MKKNSRKWRKLQKEKAERRAAQKVGEPFSKERTRRHFCLHYAGRPGGFMLGNCSSLLVPIGENECKCGKCGKIFSLDKYQQMEKLVSCLSISCFEDGIEELSVGLEPVYYRRISETETEILDVVDGQIIVPRQTCI